MSWQTGPAAARPGQLSSSSCRLRPAGRTRWTCCYAVTTSRVGQAALTAVGAAVYDDTGALVAAGVGEYEHDLREHAAAA
jgi:hypothetical protein